MSAKHESQSYAKLKRKYEEYLETYKKMNRGSTKGATPFRTFYLYLSYTTVYNDPRVFSRMGYN